MTGEHECWRNIQGAPGYHVSDQGRVRGRRDNCMTACLNTNFVHTVCLYIHGVPCVRTIARLVLRTFRGPPSDPVLLAGHLDGNAARNWLSNLAWMSREDVQWRRCHIHSRMPVGRRERKLSSQDMDGIRALAHLSLSGREIAGMFDVSQSYVSKIQHMG